MRVARALMFAAALLADLSAMAAETAPETGPCSLADAEPATVALIDEDFELLLDDGRRLALVGLEFPAQPALRQEAVRRFSELLSGKEVFVGAFAGAPDRWGRLPARVFLSEGDGPLVSAGVVLLAEGRARFRPDPPAASCATAYRAAEAQARAGRFGLWSLAENGIIVAEPNFDGDNRRFDARRGMALVEGRVQSVRQSEGVAYVNFGPRRGRDFALVISRRNVAMFEKAGVFPRAWTGRRVRARGLIDTHFGPRMDISSPAQIEILDESR